MPRAGDLPLEQIIRIAAFRSDLRAFQQHTDRISRKWGLTPQRYLLLLAIKGAPDGQQRLSFTDLAETLRLSRNTVTELCSRAEAAGLIEREPAEHDLRVVYLRLSKLGERQLNRVLRENEEFRHDVLESFADLTASFRNATRPG
ncbi:MAG TPA: MarR family transcriptional regulator [Gaiellaceae bacterium]|nr:MarR family transcriptional regulator [Gaiellaceae bacterium]